MKKMMNRCHGKTVAHRGFKDDKGLKGFKDLWWWLL